MPTVFQRIEDELGSNNFVSKLSAQADNISSAATMFSNLSKGEGVSFEDVLNGIGELDIPNINVVNQITPVMNSLNGAIPSDLSGITGGLDSVLEIFSGGMIGEISEKIEQFVRAIQALDNLRKNGFSLTSSSTSSGTGSDASAESDSTPDGPESGPPPDSGSSEGGTSEDAEPGSGDSDGSGAADTSESSEASHGKRMAAMNAVNNQLSLFEKPYSAITLLRVMHNFSKSFPSTYIDLRKVPFFSDLSESLDAAFSLSTLDAPALAAHIQSTTATLADFIEVQGTRPINRLGDSVDTWHALADKTLLKTEMTQVADTLEQIQTAVQSSDVSGVSDPISNCHSALDTLLPGLVALHTDEFRTLSDDIIEQFDQLPLVLERSIRKILQVVDPAQPLKLLEGLNSQVDALMAFINPTGIADEIERFLGRITNAIDLVDGSVVGDVLSAPSDGLRAAGEMLESVLSELASQVSALFDEVDNVLTEVDPTVITGAVEEAFTDFVTLLQSKMDELFEPVRQIIKDAVEALKNAVGAFDPEDVIDAFQSLIEQLKTVLEGEDIQNALNAIKAAIETATDTLSKLSFSPVTDGVLDEIGKVTSALEAVDPDTLSTAAKAGLTAAKALLPGDITGLTDPMVSEVEGLIAAGPTPLVNTLKSKTDALMQQVMDFSPSDKIGPTLAAPYRALLDQLDAFEPSALLDPLEAELEKLKDTIKDRADIAPLTEPLEVLFDELMEQMEKLNPAELIQPLEEAISNGIDAFLDLLPTDEIFDALDAVIGAIEDALEVANSFKEALENIVELMESLENASQQIRDWLAPVLDHVSGFGDMSAFQSEFDNVNAAVDKLRAGALQSLLASRLDAAKSALADLDADGLQRRISTAYRNISRSAVEALPDSVNKTGILALLDRFNPMDVSFNGPLTKMKNVGLALADEFSTLSPFFERWDTRFHSPDGPLQGLKKSSLTAADLRALLEEGIEHDIVLPLGQLLTMIYNASRVFREPLDAFTEFLDEFNEKVSDLLIGPDALGGVRDSLQALIDQLRAIDLQFLVRELEEVFNSVKGKMEAVSPEVFREIIQAAIDNTIDLIDISQLIPEASLTEIDGIYQTVIDDLKKLDPEELIVKVVDPLFEETLKPIVQKFDLSQFLQVVLDRLDNLDEELKEEFDRVNGGYVKMRNAIPEASLADLAGDIGGSLGF